MRTSHDLRSTQADEGPVRNLSAQVRSVGVGEVSFWQRIARWTLASTRHVNHEPWITRTITAPVRTHVFQYNYQCNTRSAFSEFREALISENHNVINRPIENVHKYIYKDTHKSNFFLYPGKNLVCETSIAGYRLLSFHTRESMTSDVFLLQTCVSPAWFTNVWGKQTTSKQTNKQTTVLHQRRASWPEEEEGPQ